MFTTKRFDRRIASCCRAATGLLRNALQALSLGGQSGTDGDVRVVGQSGQDDSSRPWAIYGGIVSDEGSKDGWIVVKDGTIACVGCAEADIPQNARRIPYDGYIYPGLIDTHNHVDWNCIPRWSGGIFPNRYAWQKDPGYLKAVQSVFGRHIREAGLEYDSIKYSEVRALIGGTTLVQSCFKEIQPKLLVRDLDLSFRDASYTPSIFGLPEEVRLQYMRGLDSGALRRIFFHIAEGQAGDIEARTEFGALDKAGLARQGVVVIHGVAVTAAQFAIMQSRGMFLVWSPQSNWNLYHETTDVPAAIKAGVVVALSPDWTISGSNNLLEELKFADAYSRCHWNGSITPRDLFCMATTNAAQVAGVENQLGRIAAGYCADFFLAPKLDVDPFASLLKTLPRHIHLVCVGGKPIYGDATAMADWTTGSDPLTVDGAEKRIVTTCDTCSGAHEHEHFEEIVSNLRHSMPKLAPLIED